MIPESLVDSKTIGQIDSVIRSGLWNPYTPSGTIVVGGVVASVHSEWLLDALLDAFARPDLLPAAYQVHSFLHVSSET